MLTGTAVIYHGSKTEFHGEWIYDTTCDDDGCQRCGQEMDHFQRVVRPCIPAGERREAYDAVERHLLIRFRGGVEERLTHVRATSFAPVAAG